MENAGRALRALLWLGQSNGGILAVVDHFPAALIGAVFNVVDGHAAFGAHDLRRTCAKLCRNNGGDLEQIKFLLGHSSIQTTERYLGSDQEIAIAVNDKLGLG